MKQILISILIFASMISISFAEFQRIEIINAVQRKAVCNDGSPGIYYFEPGSGNGIKRWVIVLPGGGYCNVPPCIGRDRSLMTSLDKPRSLGSLTSGLLSNNANNNPDFYNANHISIPYCTSDLVSGNRLDTSRSKSFQFRGRTVFRSVIRDLTNRNGSNLKEQGTEILLAGWSAGGVGVMVNLDWLSEQLPHAKVRGLNDGGWMPEQSSFSADVESELVQGIKLWQGVPDQDCLHANQGNKGKCYISSVFSYIKTPIFIQMSQRDFALPEGWLPNPIFPPPHYTQAEISKAVRDSLVPVNAAFSPRTRTHVLSQFESFTRLKVNGYSLANLLGNWFFDRAGPTKIIKK